MSLYAIRLHPEYDIEDFLCALGHAIWDALVMVNQVGDPHHYPFMERRLREFIRPLLVLCDAKSCTCWRAYDKQFERRAGDLALRPVAEAGLCPYLEAPGTRQDLAKALSEWLTPRLRDILCDRSDLPRATGAVYEAALAMLQASTKEASDSGKFKIEGGAPC